MSNDVAAQLKFDFSLIETLKKDKEEKTKIEEKTSGAADVTGKKHSLESRSYWAPYTCVVCNKFIWGYVCLCMKFKLEYVCLCVKFKLEYVCLCMKFKLEYVCLCVKFKLEYVCLCLKFKLEYVCLCEI